MPFDVFLASPSDTEEERAIVRDAVATLNSRLKLLKVDGFNLKIWEDLPPALHQDGAQGVIDAEIDPAKCDLVIGIFSGKFGQPNAQGRTPTEHEVRRAVISFKERSTPDVALFFREGQEAPSDTPAIEQLLAIRRFRDEMSQEGLIGEYRTFEELRKSVEDKLFSFALRNNPISIRCVAESNPSFLRWGGLAELLSPIRVHLFPSDKGGRPLKYDIWAFTSPPARITSAIDPGENNDAITEASLILRDADGTAVATYSGRLVGNNGLLFSQVDVRDLPATLEVSGVRINTADTGPTEIALQVVLEDASDDAKGPTGIIKERIVCGKIPGPNLLVSLNGYLSPTVTPCSYIRPEQRGNDSIGHVIITIAERWVSAFDKSPSERNPQAFPTRFRIQLQGIEQRIKGYASDIGYGESRNKVRRIATNVLGDGVAGQLIEDFLPNAERLRLLRPTHGVEIFTWEWQGHRNSQLAEESFQLHLAFVGTYEDLRSMRLQLQVSLAPDSTVFTAHRAASIPRFAPTPEAVFEVRFGSAPN